MQGAVVVVAGKSVRVSRRVLGLVQELLDAAPDIDTLTIGEVNLKISPAGDTDRVSCYVTKGRPSRKV